MRYICRSAKCFSNVGGHHEPQARIRCLNRSGPHGAAEAGQTISDVGAMACVNDKWDEKEPEKGHKLVDFAGRCINVPDDPAAPKNAGECVGNYEYMPDESWKGSGTCTYTFKGGDTLSDSWEEGSHLKEYTYKFTRGTGKYQGASGGGT